MNFVYILLGIIILFLVLKLLALPMKIIIKLVINGVIGGLIIFLINLFGASFGFILELNWITSLIVGILGIPGVILVTILHFIL